MSSTRELGLQQEVVLVAAVARGSQVIGVDNRLPWHLPEDLAHFKRVTLDKTIVMGRKTFDSIGRALPRRENVVLTRDSQWAAKGVLVCHGWDQLRERYAQQEELMIIGGAGIYKQALAMATRLIITWVDWMGEGDAHFPEFDCAQWQVESRHFHAADEKNSHDCEFVEYVRSPG